MVFVALSVPCRRSHNLTCPLIVTATTSLVVAYVIPLIEVLSADSGRDGQMDRWTDKMLGGCMGGWLAGCIGGWVAGWIGGWVKGCMGR